MYAYMCMSTLMNAAVHTQMTGVSYTYMYEFSKPKQVDYSISSHLIAMQRGYCISPDILGYHL